jgi:PAS domain S-box-containing protein
MEYSGDEALDRKLRDISVMYELVSSIGTSLDLEVETERFLEKLLRRFGFELGSIMIRDIKDEECFVIVSAKGFGYTQDFIGKRFSADQYGIREVLRGGKPIIKNVLNERDREWIIEQETQHRICSYAFLPILFKDKIGGILRLFSYRENIFTEKYLGMFQSLLRRLGIAIHHIMTINKLHLTEGSLIAEKEHLSVTLQSIADGVIVTDGDGKVVLVNKVAESLTGWTEEEAKGKTVNEVFYIVNEKTQICNESYVNNILKTGNADSLSDNYILIGKNTTKRLIADTGAPIRDQNGNVIGVVLVFRDAAEKRRAEEELKKSEERYRALYEDNPSMYFTVDSQGQVLSVNPFGAEQLGYTAHELIGQSVLNVFYPDDKEAVKYQVEICLHNPGKVQHWELRKVRKDGSMLWVREAARAVRGSDGDPVVLVVCEDITKRKQTEEQHKKLEQQLLQAQKMEAVGQLAGGIAHDFNNLLTAIIGYGHLLKNEAGKNDRMSSYIGQILNAAERAAILTNDLLTFSRKQIVNPQPVNLNKIIKDMKSLLLRVIGEDIELSTVLTDADLTIMADITQIDQILMNLATNAQDAMPGGGSLIISTGRVELNGEYIKAYGCGTPGSYALLSVEDTGAGIDEKIRERIFEPFFTTKEVGKGTGLGLAMVYGIVKQHDGYVNVYSEPGRGTTFKILLPLIQSKVEELKPDELIKVKGGNETILIGEDDAQVRALLKEVLSHAGYHIMEAVDGDDAVNVFHKYKDNIHLFILDVIMPKKNGKEVYTEIKRVQSNIKVIFVSGYSADVIHKKGILEVGLNFISKPIAPDELLIKVRNVLDN